MITSEKLSGVLGQYDTKNISVTVLGSHSALEIMDGAKDENMRTICFCQKGREVPYLRFKRLADEVIVLDKFSDLANKENQEKMLEMNSILVPHRALTAYVGYDIIENDLLIPIFGNRGLLRAEERNYERNQYYLLEKAGIRHPKLFRNPSEIESLAMVKIQEATRRLERAFFLVSSQKDYIEKSRAKVNNRTVNEEDLKYAIIEEYVVGTYFNFNFFYSPLKNETEFLGIERRLQSNLNDYNSLPAARQLDFEIEVKHVEIGHTPATIRESMLEKIFELGDKFVNATQTESPPGIIGPFSLQSIVTADFDIVVYDVSLRVPGNPILATTTPYTKYLYGTTFGVGKRIAMELKSAISAQSIHLVTT
ncbi:MAG TPA: formate--phosphoribosylaminoimidazolecarboxamide ligase family protein [Nitrososphaeraceae archaeon]|jgi:5-formaminoimidazole-4-carboxamide-1-(beta)-D-ribofuranosyl 5'-monophosphate synthetase